MTDTRRGEFPVPTTYKPGTCRSCGAAIVWTTTANKRPIPLSVATIRVDEQGHKFALSHFADCPNAGGHRKPSTPPHTTIDMRDYPGTMDRLGLKAIGSGMDEDGRITVVAVICPGLNVAG